MFDGYVGTSFEVQNLRHVSCCLNRMAVLEEVQSLIDCKCIVRMRTYVSGWRGWALRKGLEQ